MDKEKAAWQVSTRVWTISALLAVFVVLTAMQYVVSSRWYAAGFDAAEQADLLSRARHAQALIETARRSLASTTEDYGVWDASVDFVTGRGPTYPTDNWQLGTFNRFSIDAVIILDAEDRVLLAREVDRAANRYRELTVDSPLVRSVRWQGEVRAAADPEEETSGYHVIAGSAYLWSLAPIRLSEDTGAPQGHIALFRRLDADMAGASLRFAAVRNQGRVAAYPAQQTDLQFDLPEPDAATVRFELAELPSGARLQLSLSAERTLLATVRRARLFTLLTNLVIGAALALVAVWLLQWRVLKPLESLARRVGEIGIARDDSLRVPSSSRRDEIAAVVEAINRMLATIASKRNAEAARDAALEASRLKSEFLAVMSHEIRTPMNGILGMLELLAGSDINAQQRVRLQIARQSAESLLELLNGILDLSRLEAGRMQTDLRAVDVPALVVACADLFRDQAADKSLELDVELAPEVSGFYITDGSKLQQILVNLIGNAVKFTERGRISVRVAGELAGSSRHRLRIEVADTGIGIAPPHLENIFQPFTQEHGGISRRFGGSGLGLAISRRLADLLGYRLTVSSVLGKGSCFTLEAMLERTAVAPSLASAANGPTAGGALGLHVLVAEDNAVNQTLIGAVLDHFGCSYVLVENGREAVAQFVSTPRPFDAILMDVNMPELDGLEATRQIRALEIERQLAGRQPVRIIGVTANAMVGDRESCLAAGMDDYIAKPYRTADVRAALAA